MSCLGGDGVAVAHSLFDNFRLQGRQRAAQASCAGSLQCVFTGLWTSSVLRSLQTALGWAVISTETVHPSLSSPPWFVPWHSALPMKLGCLLNETNYKCNYPGFICQRNRYKIWKKKDYKWSKSQLNNGIHPLLHYWPGMQTASSFPSFLAEDHYVSGLAASLLRRAIPIFKMSHIYSTPCMVHCQTVCCTYVRLCQCPAACSQVFIIKKVPQEQIFSPDLSLKAGCSLTYSSVGAWWELQHFRHNLIIWWYSNPLFLCCELSGLHPVFPFSEFGQWLISLFVCVCVCMYKKA